MAGFRNTQLSHRYDELREPVAGLAIQALIEDQGLKGQIDFNGSFSVSSEAEYLDGIKYVDNRPSTTDAEKEFDTVTGQYKNVFTPGQMASRGWNAPTWAEITAELNDMKAEYASYAGKRKRIYPGVNDQLDQLFHDIEDGKLDKTGSWYTAIKAIKDANS